MSRMRRTRTFLSSTLIFHDSISEQISLDFDIWASRPFYMIVGISEPTEQKRHEVSFNATTILSSVNASNSCGLLISLSDVVKQMVEHLIGWIHWWKVLLSVIIRLLHRKVFLSIMPTPQMRSSRVKQRLSTMHFGYSIKQTKFLWEAFAWTNGSKIESFGF